MNIVKKLNTLGTTISYPIPRDEMEYERPILAFFDAYKGDTHGQLGVLTGLLISELRNNVIYHSLPLLSQ